MSSKLLVHHPGPFSTESLLGFVLRISEVNGYLSPWSVYRLAGMKQNETRTTGMKLERLSAITNRPISELRKIAYSHSGDHSRKCRLLGHELVPTDLKVVKTSLCVTCVAEKGFIEAHWHLVLMTGCPIHGCSLVTTCSQCGKTLRWFRQGLLTCACGADLLQTPPPIAQKSSALLAIIRNSVLGERQSDGNLYKIPNEELLGMDLRSLLHVVRTLGKHRLLADGLPDYRDPSKIVAAAAEVLCDWPGNFFQLLTDTESRRVAEVRGGVCAHFQSLYTALFKRQAAACAKQSAFLRKAFLEFVAKHWTSSAIDSKLVGNALEDITSKRYLSVSDVSAIFKVQPTTAARFIKQHPASFHVKSGRSTRVLIDSQKVIATRTVPGKVLRAREAAKLLRLPVSVLSQLRKSGLFEVNNLFPSKPGYHERDVEAFRQRLLLLCRGSVKGASTNTLTLGQVVRNRHTSVDTRVSILRALLEGKLEVVGWRDKMVEGLLLDREACRSFIGMAPEKTSAGMTAGEAAKLLLCDAGCIRPLVQDGHVTGRETPTGIRVEGESVEAFKRDWESLASIARKLGTSSRALVRGCQARGIFTLLVPTRKSGSPQPFVRMRDHARIVSGRDNSN